MFDGKAWGIELVAIVKGYVDGAAAPLLEKIGELDARLAGMPKPSTPEEIIAFVGAVMPQKAVEADPEILAGLVREQVRTAVAAIPVAKEADLSVPEDIAGSIATAVRMLAHMPDMKEAPTPAPSMNIYFPAAPELKLPDNVVNVSLPEQQAPVVNMAAPVVNVAPAAVSVEMPRRGKEITRVTAHDKAGRITEFERHEVDDD